MEIRIGNNMASSVYSWGRGGSYILPIGLLTKKQNKKNTTFLALLRLSFALELTKKWFKAFFETYIQRGLICQKLKSPINENFRKYPKISNQIWSLV